MESQNGQATSDTMFRKLGIQLIIIGIFLGCCEGIPKPKSESADLIMANNLVLQCDVRLESDDELAIEFEILNTTNTDVYLFTPLVEFREQDYVPIDKKVYVFWENDKVVVITKRLWPIPEDVEVYMPEMPFLTKVPQGNFLRKSIKVPTPLMVNNPYDFEGSGPQEIVCVSAEKVKFSIGYVLYSELPEGVLRESAEDSNLFETSYGSVINAQRYLESKPFGIAVEVKELR